MNRFAFANPRSFQEAADLLADKKYTLPVLKGGGIDLVDRMKEGLTEPDLVVNVRRLKTDSAANPIIASRGPRGNLRIEATTTLAEIADSPTVRSMAPVLAQAVEWAASPQVRNMATAAGNLLQRPRCWYYRHAQTECLKKGGPTCFAVDGENKYHAIFGDGPCHIVHPSNLAPALTVCNGVVHVIGGERESIPLAELFHMPDQGVRSENNLKPGEVVTHITCDFAKTSGFYAIKEKQSFDWPLAAASVVLQLDGPTIASARVCAGAVAPVPWRLPKVEEALQGVSIEDDAALRKACALSTEGAKPMTENAYKLKLLPVAVRRAVLVAAGRAPAMEVPA
jgi:xanthine dehydrogenase YagS FAD-binding subunit